MKKVDINVRKEECSFAGIVLSLCIVHIFQYALYKGSVTIFVHFYFDYLYMIYHT